MAIWYVVLVLVSLSLLSGEIVIRHRRRDDVDLRETRTSLGVGVVAYSLAGVSQLGITAMAWWVPGRFAWWHLSPWNPLVWIAYLTLDDFVGYWVHRASHRCRLLWSAHLVHHSATDMTMANAARISPVEAVYQPLTNVWAPLLGFPGAIYAPMTVAYLLYAQLQHTRVVGSLGALDRWLTTPSNHRVHHARNPAYIDRNFGGWTMVWDRLFGTYTPEHERPVYGVKDRLVSNGVFGTAAGGFPALAMDVRAAGSAGPALLLTFGPPGEVTVAPSP